MPGTERQGRHLSRSVPDLICGSKHRATHTHQGIKLFVVSMWSVCRLDCVALSQTRLAASHLFLIKLILRLTGAESRVKRRLHQAVRQLQ
eukprot:superscaffoldBa00001037_g8630